MILLLMGHTYFSKRTDSEISLSYSVDSEDSWGELGSKLKSCRPDHLKTKSY